MKKFKILIPVFNDWQSVFKLLKKIDDEIVVFDCEFSAVIINDSSTEKMPKDNAHYKNLKSLDVINMKNNQGHTRCNATGINYLCKKKDFDYLILMDGDGEDRPEELPFLVKQVLKNKISTVVTRTKRSEGIIFQLLYQLHKLITIVFAGKNVNFGHYSCLTREDATLLSNKGSLWSNFAGTTKKHIKKLDKISGIRGLRYFGPSKMSFYGLIVHSLSIIATFKYQVLLRSIILFGFFFLINAYFFTLLFQILLIIFTITIFIVSKRESLNDLKNSENKIKNRINIHTIKL